MNEHTDLFFLQQPSDPLNF
uniref:Uncharacterized protein n=1 Tax=Arundo donax TaxID=35708 RepID=A0A0A9FCS3_ARUDO